MEFDFYASDKCALCGNFSGYGNETCGCEEIPVVESEPLLVVAVDEPATMTCGFCGYPLLPGEDNCWNC